MAPQLTQDLGDSNSNFVSSAIFRSVSSVLFKEIAALTVSSTRSGTSLRILRPLRDDELKTSDAADGSAVTRRTEEEQSFDLTVTMLGVEGAACSSRHAHSHQQGQQYLDTCRWRHGRTLA